MGFFARLLNKQPVYGGPPPVVARAAVQATAYNAMPAAPLTAIPALEFPHAADPAAADVDRQVRQLLQGAGPFPPSDVDRIVAAVQGALAARSPSSGPVRLVLSDMTRATPAVAGVAGAGSRIKLSIFLPHSLDNEAMKALDLHLAETIMADPGIAATARSGDLKGAQEQATRLAQAQVNAYLAAHPDAHPTTSPGAAHLSVSQLLVDVDVASLGNARSRLATPGSGPQLTVRLHTHDHGIDDMAGLVGQVRTAVLADSGVLDMVARGDMAGAQQRAQHVADTATSTVAAAVTDPARGVLANSDTYIEFSIPVAGPSGQGGTPI